MQRDHVAGGKEAVELDLGHACGQRLLRLAGEGLHPHVHGQGNACHGLAYVSQPHDTHRLACELDNGRVHIGEIGTVAPLAGVHLLAVVLHAVAHVEQVGKHELCHRGGAVGRHVGHRDAVLAGGIDIDHIEASGHHTYIFQLGQRLNLLAVQGHLVGEHRLGIAGAVDDQLGSRAVVDVAIAQFPHLVPRQVAGIACIGIKYYNFHVFKNRLNC